MPVQPKPWRSYKFTEAEFKERLGIHPKDTNLMLHVYPNRIEVTAEYEPPYEATRTVCALPDKTD